VEPRSESASVAAIVLAAGKSSRLGKPKQLLDWHGTPLVREVVAQVAASDCHPVFVVTGNVGEKVWRVLSNLPVIRVHNDAFASGQASSLRAGVQALDSRTKAVVLLLGDQPFIEPSTINALIHCWERSRAAIVQSRYSGTPSHPVLFDRGVFAELTSVTGDEGARSILRSSSDRIEYLDLGGQPPIDIDTDEDYLTALAI
jgi:molybdenum cofactor cytidylyltransferase